MNLSETYSKLKERALALTRRERVDDANEFASFVAHPMFDKILNELQEEIMEIGLQESDSKNAQTILGERKALVRWYKRLKAREAAAIRTLNSQV